MLETRGFTTAAQLEASARCGRPREVDLIATLGQHLLVIEVKSTFMRRSQRRPGCTPPARFARQDISFAARSKRCCWQSPRIKSSAPYWA